MTEQIPVDPSAGMKSSDPKPPKSQHILPQRYQAGFAGVPRSFQSRTFL
jgi:hypothetical protein